MSAVPSFFTNSHSLRADQIRAETVDDEIIVKGTICETALFGHVPEVRRTIRKNEIEKT